MSRNLASASDVKRPCSRRSLWVGAGVLIVALVLYLSTLLTHVPLNPNRNLIDVGEIQIALNLWGTLHHTGYPLYTVLGSAFAWMYRGLGGSPATGPSVFSLLWAMGALALTHVLYLDVTRSDALSCGSEHASSGASPASSGAPTASPSGQLSFPPSSKPSSLGAPMTSRPDCRTHAVAAAIGTLYVAVTSAFWINASIPEVYSMYMALILASLLLSRRLAERWSDRCFIWLAVLLGSAGAHHRLAAFALPAVAIYILPSFWRRVRTARWLLPVGVLAVLATFLPYLYLPLRAAQGAQWVFGAPDTWDGFWRIFIGPGRVIGGPTSAEALAGPLRVMRTLLSEAHPLGVIGGVAGLGVALFGRERRRDGLALLSLLPVYLAAAVRFPIAAVAENFLMVVVVALGAGIAVVLSKLTGRWRSCGLAALVVAAGLVASLGVRNYATVRVITRAEPDSDLVAMIDRTPRAEGDAEPAFMLPWGRHYFVAYFARHISHEIDGLAIVDHNTNFAADLAAGRRLYTLPLTFHAFPLEWWESHLGQVYLSAAAPEVVEVSDRPIARAEELPPQPPIALGDGIELVGMAVERQQEGQALAFTLYFRAEDTLATDYSVSVRVSDQDAIASSEDILAQQDAANPVFGWYPTSRWRPGEIVRDIYVVPLPQGVRPRRAEVWLYERLTSGEFRNLVPAPIELPGQ